MALFSKGVLVDQDVLEFFPKNFAFLDQTPSEGIQNVTHAFGDAFRVRDVELRASASKRPTPFAGDFNDVNVDGRL